MLFCYFQIENAAQNQTPNTTEDRKWMSYRYGEGTTGLGQVIHFTCPPDDVEEVRTFLRERVRDIEIPSTRQVNVSHGGYGRYSRYQITQHKYAGGGPGEGGGWGYIEVLEISNPPDDRHGIIIHEASSFRGASFTEWETVEDALAAFEKNWGGKDTTEVFSTLKGFKRRVFCGSLSPWFYAIGDQALLGEYCFPEGLQDDPVFQFGNRFVVYDSNGIPGIKTCMGTRMIKHKEDRHPYEEKFYRIITWSDGSVWDESNRHPWWRNEKYPQPRLIRDDELWIDDAIRQFEMILSGHTTNFSLNFLDGSKLTGKITPPRPLKESAEGKYFVVVNIKGGEIKKGWVNDFKPSPEFPSIIDRVKKGLEAQGHEIEKIEITDSKVEAGGKKWKGVFFAQPSKPKDET